MSETTLSTPPQFDPSRIKIRLDKSRDFSEIHGSRSHGDPHQHVHYYQDGLPYNAEGVLIIEHPDYVGDSLEAQKRRKTLAKKLERAMRDHAKRRDAALAEGGPDMPRGIEDVDDGDLDDGDEDDAREVNLEQWLRGEQQVPWADVSNAIALRFSKRMSSTADAIPFLADELRVATQHVAKKFQRYLPKD